MTTTQQNEMFTLTAERMYRRVYQGTLYTLTWTDEKGEHKATSRNFHNLSRFANNGYSSTGLRRMWGSSIKVIA
jgi:hypothetical protein